MYWHREGQFLTNGHRQFHATQSLFSFNLAQARFKRRILHAPNAIQTMHNEEAYLIIYCLNCIRCMQNSTFETGHSRISMEHCRISIQPRTDYWCSIVAFQCSTVALQCSTVAFVCNTVAFLCNTVAFLCSTVAFLCSTVAFLCSTVAFLCSTVALLCSTDHFYAAQSHFHAAEVALIGHRRFWMFLPSVSYSSL